MQTTEKCGTGSRTRRSFGKNVLEKVIILIFFLICQYLKINATAVNTLIILPGIQFVVFALCFGAVISQHAYLMVQEIKKEVFMSNGREPVTKRIGKNPHALREKSLTCRKERNDKQ